MSEDEAFDREMQELRRATVATFPQKVSQVANAVSSALAWRGHDAKAELEAWSTACQLAHSLRGIAAMFGATALGTAAGALEDLVAECSTKPHHDPALELRIHEQITKLTSLVSNA